jgi:mannitol-1-/sugar-/sorbitol-6-/2-deoxyglucose-6-phosphatase
MARREMIEAVIFDMDGVLVDSEPFWHEAEIEIFATVQVTLTREQCMETMGLPVEEVVAYRFQQHPWSNKSPQQVQEEILNSVIRRVQERGTLMDGVTNAIEIFASHHLPLALASSSPLRLIDMVLEKISLRNMFSIAHSVEHEKYGKPHPAVFLSTAAKLGVVPMRCLVIEDSFNGLIAAKAARMKTLVVPMEQQQHETRFDIADLKLKSLAAFSEAHWQQLNAAL